MLERGLGLWQKKKKKGMGMGKWYAGIEIVDRLVYLEFDFSEYVGFWEGEERSMRAVMDE